MISLIIPVYNEQDNLRPLHAECLEVLQGMSVEFEIIYVDDGSRDNSVAILRELAAVDVRVKVLLFARNFGQTAALAAGIAQARGDIFIFSDSDMQNDPHDIPKLIEKINEGYDVVSGWRKDRKDKALSRKIPSWLANTLISRITKIPLHDYGCTLKVYRRRVIEGVHLYGEMHRFIPIYASWYGARVVEVVVNHRPRLHGVSKYGISRTFRVILDLLFVKFWASFRSKPMHFFGGFGILLLLLSLISASIAVYIRLVHHVSFILTPLPLFSAFSFLIAFMFILNGILAEMIMRVYYESKNGPVAPYLCKEKINVD